ncbi:hypothetical protein [Novosphingobium sp.]|uniref:hypothetical protein n=1 Tax=Novosphingobium sp. TaxID=1874826 RepID=UPI002FDEC6C7
MAHGPIPALPPLDAPDDIVTAARANCAQRSRDRGDHETAVRFEQGLQDLGWAFRHEVMKLLAERGQGA